MVIAVTISCELRKIVSARSTVTRVSIGWPVWSMPVTRSVSRGSSGSGLTRKSSPGVLIAPRFYHKLDARNTEKPSALAGLFRTCDRSAISNASQPNEAGLCLTVQAAEQPDQQNDRQWNADKPKQKPSSHNSTPLKERVPGERA